MKIKSHMPLYTFKRAIGISLVALLLIFHACKKEASESQVQQPCGQGYCQNGGVCVSGVCICPQGYTGALCDSQITPSIIRIHKISVTKFPLLHGSNPWDANDGPDIFPRIRRGINTVWQSPNYVTNAVQGINHEFAPISPVDLIYPNGQYSIDLLDYDSTNVYQLMGLVYFTPYDSTGGFPSTMVVDTGGAVAFKLNVSYIW